MKKERNKLIEKILSSLDWDTIFEVNKIFKLGVGEGTTAIPGMKRKSFDQGLNKNDIKNELKILLNYAVENDSSEILYGPWMIFWSNGNWVEINLNDFIQNSEDESEDMIVNPQSTLEVIYSPQRIHVVEDIVKLEENPDSDISRLEIMLQKAIESEDYELASKIKEILFLTKK